MRIKFSAVSCIQSRNVSIQILQVEKCEVTPVYTLRFTFLNSRKYFLTTERFRIEESVVLCVSRLAQLVQMCIRDSRMGLQLVKSQLPIAGINNSLSQADFSTNVKLHSRYKPFTLNVHCAVLPSITNNLPAESFLSLIHI